MRNAVAVFFSISFLCACSAPVGPIPGGLLEGTPTAWPQDWSFIDNIEKVLLQTDPQDPYSVTIWAVRANGHLYIAAESSESNWVVNMGRDPNVILSVDGMLYAAKVESVSDRDEIGSVVQAYLTKYDIESEESFVTEDGVLFRLAPRS